VDLSPQRHYLVNPYIGFMAGKGEIRRVARVRYDLNETEKPARAYIINEYNATYWSRARFART